jgi:hypothetical protein
MAGSVRRSRGNPSHAALTFRPASGRYGGRACVPSRARETYRLLSARPAEGRQVDGRHVQRWGGEGNRARRAEHRSAGRALRPVRLTREGPLQFGGCNAVQWPPAVNSRNSCARGRRCFFRTRALQSFSRVPFAGSAGTRWCVFLTARYRERSERRQHTQLRPQRRTAVPADRFGPSGSSIGNARLQLFSRVHFAGSADARWCVF